MVTGRAVAQDSDQAGNAGGTAGTPGSLTTHRKVPPMTKAIVKFKNRLESEKGAGTTVTIHLP